MAKRVFDLFFSIFGLLVLWPLLLLIAIIIVLYDGSPIFFRQERVGYRQKKFKILKFRTMSVGSSGSEITVAGDSRITPVGAVLRRYKLDELPQLINVLVGEMSFVGPRPEVEAYTRLYSPEQKIVFNVRPGITDLASIKYFRESEILSKSDSPEETYRKEIMPDKLKLNIEYIEKRSLFLDIKIIVATVLGRKGL